MISYVYELPFGPGKALLNQPGVLGKIVGGWEVNGITVFMSGPLSRSPEETRAGLSPARSARTGVV